MLELGAVSTALPTVAVEKLLQAVSTSPTTAVGCSLARTRALDEAIGWVKRMYPQFFK